MNITPVKRALISVSDKAGLVEFARILIDQGVEIISTGGTSKLLLAENIPHRQVDELTGLPEMLDGRVKTLHPKVHGGILGRRDVHAAEAHKHNIEWIDLVVVNFYPFEQMTQTKKLNFAEAIEYIDIGGPTMVRAAAKNYAWVGVVIDPADYGTIIEQLKTQQGLDENLRKNLAYKVFARTANYDAAISEYLAKELQLNENINLRYVKSGELRYGENPHQQASAYRLVNEQSGILTAKQYQGKPLSYNNILDSEAAVNCVREFNEPACVIVKHANPCGVAIGKTSEQAFERALAADSLSAFGGIVALNQICTKELAEAITKIFMEVVIAPVYTPEALAIFSAKTNLRILELPMQTVSQWEMRFINGGMLMQERDQQTLALQDLRVVTETQPSAQDLESMLFAWRVLKHIKSNGILLAKDNATVGIGAGQVSRIDSVEIAIRKADKNIANTVLASDAFFPFRDSIDRIAKTGVKAIIQPGGSMRDDEVIAACNHHGIAMVFTGKRCFKH